MKTLRELDIVRAITPTSVAFRADSAVDGSIGLMTGHFSVFNSWYEVNSFWEGTFLERVAPGSFSKTISEGRSSMKVLFDHGYDPQIGNKVLGPIQDLREDSTGPYYEVPLFDTSYNRDLLPGLRSGVYGASFRFQVIREEWNDEPGTSDHNPKGVPERTIKETRTVEFGPVTFPASPAATSGVRSLTDEFYAQMRSRDPGRVDALLARAQAIRTPDAGAAHQGTPDEGAAGPTDAPASSHPDGLSSAARSRLLQLPYLMAGATT